MLRIGASFDPRLDYASAFGRAVTTLGALGSLSIEFDKPGVINVAAERTLDCFKIGLVTVSG
jgi:hypothetical protein